MALLEALKATYPNAVSMLADSCGNGLNQLTESSELLEEAHHSMIHGLLASFRVRLSIRDLIISGERLREDFSAKMAKALAH